MKHHCFLLLQPSASLLFVVSAICLFIGVTGGINIRKRSHDLPELKAFNQLKQYSYVLQVTIITGDSARLKEDAITCEEEEIAKKMTLPSPLDRPTMNRMVEMMEGNVDALVNPPRPGLQIPTATLQESSTFSEDISVYTEYDP
ncbi:unnamed protein product [Thlaspi arvense]|uniref:Uncharacterized protein n=1 Tax=Thlaspi arvense TaxID=13288 RepID=A0AAU9SGX8_THLAR|nr:unnamed protein product [Thlaspi arvense]